MFKRILIFLILCVPAFGSWNFDDTAVQMWVKMADNNALNLPTGDWTIAGWFIVDDNAGSGDQYLMSWAETTVAAQSSFKFVIRQASASNANKLSCSYWDDSNVVHSTGQSAGTAPK